MLKDNIPGTHRTCPKCSGLLMHNSDRYGPYLQCTRCGKHIDLVAIAKELQATRSHANTFQDDISHAGTFQAGASSPNDQYETFLPQFTNTGCDESPSCLKCPLPFCKLDNRKDYLVIKAERHLRQAHDPKVLLQLAPKQAAAHIGVTKTAYMEAVRQFKQPQPVR